MFTPQNNSQKNLSTDTEQFKSNRQQAQPQQPADLNKMNQNKEYPFKKKEEVQEKKLAGNKGAVEDILAGTDDDAPQTEPVKAEEQVDTQTPLKLKETPNVPSMGDKNVEEQKFQPQEKEKLSDKKVLPEQQLKPKSKVNILTILIIVLVIAALVLAGFFAYQYFTTDENTTLENNNLNNNNLQETEDLQQSNEDLMDFVNSLDETEQENELGFEEATSTMPNEDTDGDGLLDIEEAELGTNLNKSDSDDDGLPDFDEVMIYSTDPLNPDTDGDSYEDGDEVENGYDPLVPGSARL